MKSYTIHLIVAARPNFMKAAPLYHALLNEAWAKPILIHTGQHYDANMSDAFFQDLNLPEPDVHLGVGSGSHAEQTAGVMLAYEKVCQEQRPDWVVVIGDVNATLACSITAKKLKLSVAHLEAGLRSGDRTMPEELNRIVTDSISDLLWTPSPDADENLQHEGVPPERIVRVGNIMLDSYEMLRPKIDQEQTAARLNLAEKGYGLVTLHRPSNVDGLQKLTELANVLIEISKDLPLAFPVHPRTEKNLKSFGLWPLLSQSPGVTLTEPLGYIQFMSLVQGAKVVMTDSGGLQEETTYLGIPCLTLRESTERPITMTQGTNQLVRPELLQSAVRSCLANDASNVQTRPDYWDGMTASRIVANLKLVLGI